MKRQREMLTIAQREKPWHMLGAVLLGFIGLLLVIMFLCMRETLMLMFGAWIVYFFGMAMVDGLKTFAAMPMGFMLPQSGAVLRSLLLRKAMGVAALFMFLALFCKGAWGHGGIHALGEVLFWGVMAWVAWMAGVGFAMKAIDGILIIFNSLMMGGIPWLIQFYEPAMTFRRRFLWPLTAGLVLLGWLQIRELSSTASRRAAVIGRREDSKPSCIDASHLSLWPGRRVSTWAVSRARRRKTGTVAFHLWAAFAGGCNGLVGACWVGLGMLGLCLMCLWLFKWRVPRNPDITEVIVVPVYAAMASGLACIFAARTVGMAVYRPAAMMSRRGSFACGAALSGIVGLVLTAWLGLCGLLAFAAMRHATMPLGWDLLWRPMLLMPVVWPLVCLVWLHFRRWGGAASLIFLMSEALLFAFVMLMPPGGWLWASMGALSAGAWALLIARLRKRAFREDFSVGRVEPRVVTELGGVGESLGRPA